MSPGQDDMTFFQQHDIPVKGNLEWTDDTLPAVDFCQKEMTTRTNLLARKTQCLIPDEMKNDAACRNSDSTSRNINKNTKYNISTSLASGNGSAQYQYQEQQVCRTWLPFLDTSILPQSLVRRIWPRTCSQNTRIPVIQTGLSETRKTIETSDSYIELNEPLAMALQETYNIMRNRAFHELSEDQKTNIRERIERGLAKECTDEVLLHGPIYGIRQLRPIKIPPYSHVQSVLMLTLVNMAVFCMHYVLVFLTYAWIVLGIPHGVVHPGAFPPMSMLSKMQYQGFSLKTQPILTSLQNLWSMRQQEQIPVRDRLAYATQQFALMIRQSALPQQCRLLSCMIHAALVYVLNFAQIHLPASFRIDSVAGVIRFVYGLGIPSMLFNMLYIFFESMLIFFETLTSDKPCP